MKYAPFAVGRIALWMLAGMGGLAWLGRPDPSVARRVQGQLAAERERCEAGATEARQLDHDLRTPLGAMAIALELLQGGDPVTDQEACDVLRRQLSRVTTLTDRLRMLSKTLAD